jgi:hypothetical protein
VAIIGFHAWFPENYVKGYQDHHYGPRDSTIGRRNGLGQAHGISEHVVLWISNRLLLCGILCDASHMATNLAIDPDLLDRAVAVSGERTKTAAVKRALEEFIARRNQSKIADLFGTLEWDPKYDYKTARSRD